MQVLVTKTARGSPNGTTIHEYKAGKTYGPKSNPPMPTDLSAVFVREGWGEEVVAKTLPAAPENKMLDGAEEDKADGGSSAAPANGEDDPIETQADAPAEVIPEAVAEAEAEVEIESRDA